MRCWSSSHVARSIAYFHLTSCWQHSVESGQARLASRPTTLKALRMMRDCRPQTSWLHGRHVFAYAFDQTYEWVGVQKRGRRQAVEHVDARGRTLSLDMLRMARMLQDAFVRTLGRDLTIFDPNNHFWHTGNSVPLYTGDFRRPWEWYERVQSARTCGKHRSRHETWFAYAERFVHERFFKF